MRRALCGAAAVAALVAAPGAAAAGPTFAASFGARSYAAGDTALLRVTGSPAKPLRLELFHAGGAPGGSGGDGALDGRAVAAPVEVAASGRGPWSIRVALGDWRSGVYAARLRGADGTTAYAPLVLRPRRLGASRVLVVEPTYTWQAYNFEGGDSWYEHSSVHVVDLTRPYAGNGLPPHFQGYDRGFLRWLVRSGHRADVVADDDLVGFANARRLRKLYDLVVFPGHEEYVTAQTFDLIEGFRNLGGNLLFLAANDFFYRVRRVGDTIVGRSRWRDLGRPEASLLGAEYIGWNEGRYPNRPYVVVGAEREPWLFAGTGLRNGSTFGKYGIEIDARGPASPPGTEVLAEIRDAFGPGATAQMTYYRRGRAQVFDAGVMNFGGSADWPVVSRLVENLWHRFS